MDDLINPPHLRPVPRPDHPLPKHRDAAKAVAQQLDVHPSYIAGDLLWPVTGFEATVDGVTIHVWCHLVVLITGDHGVVAVWHANRIRRFAVRLHDRDDDFTHFAQETFTAWWEHDGRDMVRSWRAATE